MDQPWYSLNDESDEITPPLATFETLHADMTWACLNSGDGPNYGFAQAVNHRVPDVPPRLNLSARLSYPKGGRRLTANQVVVDMEVGADARKTNPLPVEQLLSISESLVMDMVDVWNPDAVSLDSRELLKIPYRPGVTYPTIGYASWLSTDVADPEDLPPAPIKRPYKNGTLIGIRPDSPDPIQEATALAESIYARNILKIIPFVQGQPNPQ